MGTLPPLLLVNNNYYSTRATILTTISSLGVYLGRKEIYQPCLPGSRSSRQTKHALALWCIITVTTVRHLCSFMGASPGTRSQGTMLWAIGARPVQALQVGGVSLTSRDYEAFLPRHRLHPGQPCWSLRFACSDWASHQVRHGTIIPGRDPGTSDQI